MTRTEIAALRLAIARNEDVLLATRVRREAIREAQTRLDEAVGMFGLAMDGDKPDLVEADRYGAMLPGLRAALAALPKPDEAAAALASRQIATAHRRIAEAEAADKTARAPLTVKAFAGLTLRKAA